MYGFNIYEDFPHGEFKKLESYYCSAENREYAYIIAFNYAKKKYPNKNVSVMSTNWKWGIIYERTEILR